MLDVLSDVGGLNGTLLLFGNLVMGLIYGDTVKEHLVHKLFNFTNDQVESTSGYETYSKANPIYEGGSHVSKIQVSSILIIFISEIVAGTLDATV